MHLSSYCEINMTYKLHVDYIYKYLVILFRLNRNTWFCNFKNLKFLREINFKTMRFFNHNNRIKDVKSRFERGKKARQGATHSAFDEFLRQIFVEALRRWGLSHNVVP